MESTHTAPDFMQLVAREKLGAKAAEWQVFRWELIGNHETARDFVVGIGQTREMVSGPSKGNRTWRDTKGKLLPNEQVVVTDAEIDAARARYELDTGICWQCGGSGQVFSSWSKVDGVKHRQCDRCDGTGKAPA